MERSGTLGKTRKEEFENCCWGKESGNTITKQMKRLGVTDGQERDMDENLVQGCHQSLFNSMKRIDL